MSNFKLNPRWIWLGMALLSAIGMWRYVANFWSPGQTAEFSDLYAQWWAAHELLLNHRDPYSPAVAHEIQTVIYGRPVDTSYPGDTAQLAGGFAYPVYVVFVMWPTVQLGFSTARSLFLCLFVALTFASLWLWLHALQWRPATIMFGILTVFTFGSFPVLQGLKLQNLSLFAAFLVAAAIASAATERFTVAGLLLAGATIKPQFVILLIPWLALWIMANWRQRQRLAWSFSAGLSALVLGGEVLAPGWIHRFLMIVQAYRQYTYGHSLLDIWFTPRIGLVAAVALVVTVLTFCWRYRPVTACAPSFFLVVSLLLATTLVVIPTVEPHAQLLLLPGFLFLARYHEVIWRWNKLARLLVIAAWSSLAWEWVAAVGMTVAGLWIPLPTLSRYWILPLATSPVLPLGLLLVLGFLVAKAKTFSDSQDMMRVS